MRKHGEEDAAVRETSLREIQERALVKGRRILIDFCLLNENFSRRINVYSYSKISIS